MMRVITRFGLGEVSKITSGEISVQLDKPSGKPWLDKQEMLLDRISEVFLFSDWPVVRVLNISGIGWVSNLQFCESCSVGISRLSLHTPPDETTFFLDLESGNFIVNRELELEIEDVLWIQPWLDRWAIERSRFEFQGVNSAIRSFQEEKEKTVGAAGIHSSILLNVETRKILWFYIQITPPQGVIFSKRFI